MFQNSSASGNLAYIIGEDNLGELLIVIDKITWDGKSTRRLGDLLNAEDLYGQQITLNEDGRHFIIFADAKSETPKEVIIFKYVINGEVQSIVDVNKDDEVALSIALNQFMNVDPERQIKVFETPAAIEVALHNKDLIKAYEDLGERAHKEFFRGGIRDAAMICTSFRHILGCNDPKYMLDLYIFICCRASMGMSVSRTEMSFNLAYKDIEKANRFRLITFVNMHRNDLSLSCANDITLRVIDHEVNRVTNHANLLKELSKPDDDLFGLDPNNPVLTMSIPRAYTYISRLVAESGCITNTKRIGVAESTFPDLVDKYEIEISDNGTKRIVNIYIDSYAEQDTETPPKGFTLRAPSFEDAAKDFAYSNAVFNKRHPKDDENNINN